MEWIRLIGFCLLAAVMVMLLRQMHPPVSGLLSAAFGVMLLGVLLPEMKEYVDTIGGFLSSLQLDGQYYRILLKSMGIALVTQLAVQICQDMDAPLVARRAAFCGRIAMLGIAIPVFIDLTQLAVSVLQ